MDVPAKRGRPPKSTEKKAPPPHGIFKCSKCDFVATYEKDCYRHIYRQHQGQALINDESGRSLTRTEQIKGFKEAIKLLKILNCPKCPKTFKTHLGLIYHLELCGLTEDETFTECDICGKRLKLHSVPAHMKAFHPPAASSPVQDDSSSSNPPTVEQTGESKKRHSAIKALQYLQNLDIGEEEPKSKESDDGEFMVSNGSESEEVSDHEEDGYEAGPDEEHLVLDDVGRKNQLPTLSSADLERLFIYFIDYVIRESNSDQIVRILPKEISRDENGLYCCYQQRCPSRFTYRFELENHYKRCSRVKFVLQCLFPNCPSKFNFKHNIDSKFFAHFFRHHADIIPVKFLEEFQDFFQPFYSVKSHRNRPNPADNRVYHKELLSLYHENALKPKIFRCLRPRLDHFRIVETNHQSESVKSPKFKCSSSMENGDNEIKKIEPFESIRIDQNCLMFNVGEYVTNVAWCPLPMLVAGDQPSQFLEALSLQNKNPRNQYLAIATNLLEDVIKFRAPKQVRLQIWDVGPLTTEGCEENPKLAMNIDLTDCGDILDFCWAPNGCTHEDGPKQSNDLNRMGLLAVATEDGLVRVFTLPHPAELADEFRPPNVVQIKPVLTLRHRFSKYQNCNSVQWYPYYPYDMIIGGYNDGHICLWKLNNVAECSGQDLCNCPEWETQMRLPNECYLTHVKCFPVLKVHWLNSLMFVVSMLENYQVYHLEYDGLYEDHIYRVPFRKIATHPLWVDATIMMDMVISRDSNCLYMRYFDSDHVTDSLFTSLTFECNIQFNDMSISPWMNILAYATENGQLCTTSLLRKPPLSPKKLPCFVLYDIKLSSMKTETVSTNDTNSGDKKSKPKNTLLHETIDLKHSLQGFLDDYCFIFNDISKPSSLFRSKPLSSNTVSVMLTKNDLYRYYAVTNCAWNPNLGAHYWMFTATKSGLCRLNNYDKLQDPRNS